MKSLLKIESLTINNFATIKNQTVSFEDGFNVIVGETGSGKSLILDALQLTFGARADKKQIRKGSSFSSVEVSFSIKKEGTEKVSKYCDDLGFPFEDNIHIKRIIYKEGNSKAFLNHQSCPLSKLNQFTRKFIDLVGQFENQKLLSSDYQLKLLDNYSSLGEQFREYTGLFNNLKSSIRELEELSTKFENREREMSFLEYQIDEFDSLNPSEEEENKLIKEKESILGAEKLSKLSQEFQYFIFDDPQHSLINRLKEFSRKLSMTPLDELKECSEKIDELEISLHEISEQIRKHTNIQENSHQRLEEVIDTLDRYQKLKRKFNLPTQDLKNKMNALKEELKSFSRVEEKIQEIKENIASIKERCFNLAHQLNEARTKASISLSKELTSSIQKLNMEGASIQFVCQENNELSSSGLTKLDLLAETNPGEGFYKLSEIASGGELSRVLLSLRHLMTSQDSISIFLFDEIDTGIGGKTASKIGQMLQEISLNAQVIAITHLPQIAKFSQNLILVEKETSKENGTRTESKVINLKKDRISQYIEQEMGL